VLNTTSNFSLGTYPRLLLSDTQMKSYTCCGARGSWMCLQRHNSYSATGH